MGMPFLMIDCFKPSLYRFIFFCLLPAIVLIRQPDRKQDIMAKSYYTFQKRQKELDKKKKQEEKRQRKLENKIVETDETNETDETENDPTPSTENR